MSKTRSDKPRSDNLRHQAVEIEHLSDSPVLHEIYQAKKKLFLTIVAFRNLTNRLPSVNPVFQSEQAKRIKVLEQLWEDLDELGKTHAVQINTSSIEE